MVIDLLMRVNLHIAFHVYRLLLLQLMLLMLLKLRVNAVIYCLILAHVVIDEVILFVLFLVIVVEVLLAFGSIEVSG